TAYADGVNGYLHEREKSTLPGEVRKLGIVPRPWKVTDSIAIGEMMARRFGGGGGGELRNLQALSFLKTVYGEKAQQVFDDLVWQNDPAAPATIPAAESPRDPLGRSVERSPEMRAIAQRSLVPERPRDVEPARAAADKEAELANAAAKHLPTRWGSYGIVVAPARRVT